MFECLTVPFIMFITLKGCSNVIAKPIASRYFLSVIKFDNSCCLWGYKTRNSLIYKHDKSTGKELSSNMDNLWRPLTN